MERMLQVAVDVIELSKAVKIAYESYINGADIIEAGTPLIKMHGTLPIKIFKEIAEDKFVLADLKTLDAGKLEAEIAFSSGADIVSISALADIKTITDVIDVAREHGGKVCVDLLNVKEMREKIKWLLNLNVDYILIHLGLDQQARGLNIVESIRPVADLIPKQKLSVAGGIGPHNIHEILVFNPSIVVVGGAIYKSEKPGEVVKNLKNVLLRK